MPHSQAGRTEAYTTPHIPTELYEAIIDQADHATLKNCALVCRALRPRCQRLLFSRVTLDSPPWRRHLRSASFYDLISRYPHLCLYVEALEISEHDQSPWISTDVYLGCILPQLRHLQELAIVGRVTQWGRLNMDAVHDHFRAAVLSRCRSPQLATLKLTNIREIPSDMLRQASGLKSLTLVNCSLKHGKSTSAGDNSPAPILRNLAVVRWRSIIEWLHFSEWIQDGNLDVSQLVSLRLNITALDQLLPPQISQGLDVLKFLIEQSSPTVESMDLQCPASAVIWSSYDLLDLANMPRLRTLILYGSIWDGEIPEDAGLQWYIDTLRKIPSHRHFEAVSLLFDIQDDISIVSAGFAGRTDWSAFVAVIQALHERTLALDVTFHVANSRGPYVPDIIHDKLAPLAHLGVLSVRQTMITTDLVLFGT